MPKVIFGVSPTNTVLRVKLLDSTATDGRGLTGLTSSSSGLIISTIKIGESAPTVYAVSASNVETITTLGTYAAPTTNKCRFKEVSSAYHKGIYELQFANARFSATDTLLVSIAGATNLSQADFEVQCKNLAADIKAIDGELTNGNNATLYLKQLNIKNTGADTAVDIQSDQGTAVNIRAVDGGGISIGTLNGTGVSIDSSNSTSLSINSESGNAVNIHAGYDKNAVQLINYGIGNGLLIQSDDTAVKIVTNSGGSGIGIISTGDGINVSAAQTGINVKSTGNNAAVFDSTTHTGMTILGGSGGCGTEIGLFIGSMSPDGSALHIENAIGSNSAAVNIVSNGVEGVKITGHGAGAGLSILGGDTGHGINIECTDTIGSGDGIHIVAGYGGGINVSSSDPAMKLTSELTGLEITSTDFGSSGVRISGANNSSGLTIIGSTNGVEIVGAGEYPGVSITGGETGNGVTISSGATSGNGVSISGTGTGNGIRAVGGATGHGIYGLGGATSGDGMRVVSQTAGNGMVMQGAATGHGLTVGSGSGATGNGINVIASSTNGYGLRVDGSGTGAGALFYGGAQGSGLNIQGNGTASHGLNCAGAGTGHGLYATGGATGNGAQFQGGATSGGGLRIAAMAGNSTGMYVTGSGSEDAIKATGGATGAGIRAIGGATSGYGMYVAAQATSHGMVIEGIGTGKCGIVAIGSTNGDGINTTGGGNGHGIRSTGGSTGQGIAAFGGATSGNGIYASATVGSGLYLVAGGASPGLYCAGGTNGNGMSISGTGTGKGIHILGGSGGAHAFLCEATGAGHGIYGIGNGTTGCGMMLARGGVSGYDLAGNTPSTNIPMNITQINGANITTGSAMLGVNVVSAAGTAWGSGAITAGSIATGAITNAKFASGAIDATAIATGAITNTKFAAGAIDSAVLSAGAITNAKFASGAINSVVISAGAITNTKFAAGAIDAAAIATDAIGSAEFAQAAADKIWASATRTLTSVSGLTIAANITQIDGQATNGNNATLNLKQLNIVNNSGSAFIASSTGGNGHGFYITGNGTGNGVTSIAGLSNAHGFYIVGNGTGNGINSIGGNSNGHGMYLIKGVGTGHDLTFGTPDCTIPTTTQLTNAVNINSNSDITAIKAKTDQLVFIVDGVSTSAITSNLLSMASGKFKKDFPNPGDVTFYKQDNTTPAFTMNITSTQRTRTYQAP